MLDSLLSRAQQRMFAVPFGAGPHGQQPFHHEPIRAVVIHVRKVFEHFEQHGFVVGFRHGGRFSWLVDDAARVAAKGSAPATSIGGAA